MDNYSRKVCQNIKALCRINAYQIGNVEKSIGRSPGYFSRCKNISVEDMILIAKKFEISVDDLIRNNYGQELVKLECQDEIYASIARMKDLMSKDDAMKLIINAMNLAYGGEAE